jgi:hypothetical protein
MRSDYTPLTDSVCFDRITCISRLRLLRFRDIMSVEHCGMSRMIMFGEVKSYLHK